MTGTFFYVVLQILFLLRTSCTCFPGEANESIRKANAIFIGKVLKVDSVFVVKQSFIDSKISTRDSGAFVQNKLSTIKIAKRFKGTLNSDIIQVITGQG